MEGCAEMVVLVGGLAWGQAPAEPLTSLDGRQVSLSELKGKIAVLSFGGTWVPMISRELTALQRIGDRYAGREVEVYWISINSDKPGTRNHASDADLRAFLQKSNLRLKVLRDPSQTAYRAFDLTALPTIVILDRQGKVARTYVGIGTEQGDTYTEIIREIEALLK